MIFVVAYIMGYVGKCVELHDICFKTAKMSLQPMAKWVELQEKCYRTAKLEL